MSDLHQLGPLIYIQKGKPPKSFEANNANAQAYLSPEYLRGIAPPSLAEPFPNSLMAAFGDVVLLWDGSNAGEAFRARPGIVASTMAVIRPDQSFDLGYFFHALKWVEPYLKSQTNGTGIPHVDRYVLEKVAVYRPAKPDQTKIAEVLDTLDAAIRGTEAVVAKLRAMKQGLLHDLLNRGIDANGDLRPPHPEAPHLYHQTPLGWLPKAWDWGRLEDYCSRICVGIVIKPADHYVDDGVPTFRSANVREGYISESDFVFISAASNALLHKSQIRKGDILTVRTGYPGTSAVVPEKYDGCNCVDILISTPLNSISSEFLCSWINSPFGKGQVLSGQGGLAQQHFNVGEMRELIVVKPLKAEQEEITLRIDAAEVRIQSEQNLLDKLRLQKSGLMDDLLTGRVPVTPLL